MISGPGERKQSFASSHFKFILAGGLALAVLILALVLCRGQQLQIVSQTDGAIVRSHAVRAGDTVIFGWIHSVEHTPWTEEYRIEADGRLTLTAMTIEGFGAGIPHNKGTQVSTIDGVIRYEAIDEVFPAIEWIHSRTALEFIRVNDELLLAGPDLPHHESFRLQITKGYTRCPRSKPTY